MRRCIDQPLFFIIWTLFIFFHDPCRTWCKEQLAQGCLMECQSLHHAYLQTHTAVGLEGAMEAGWANRARGSQRNPGKNRDTGKCSVAEILRNVSNRWLNKAPTLYLNLLITCCTWPYTFYPHQCQLYWKKKYALNGIIHLHSHSFQFVSTTQYNAPSL